MGQGRGPRGERRGWVPTGHRQGRQWGSGAGRTGGPPPGAPGGLPKASASESEGEPPPSPKLPHGGCREPLPLQPPRCPHRAPSPRAGPGEQLEAAPGDQPIPAAASAGARAAALRAGSRKGAGAGAGAVGSGDLSPLSPSSVPRAPPTPGHRAPGRAALAPSRPLVLSRACPPGAPAAHRHHGGGACWLRLERHCQLCDGPLRHRDRRRPRALHGEGEGRAGHAGLRS